MEVNEDHFLAQPHDGDRRERRVAGIFEDRRPVVVFEALLRSPAAIQIPLGELDSRRALVLKVEEGRNEPDIVRVRVAHVEDDDGRVDQWKPSTQRRTFARSPF